LGEYGQQQLAVAVGHGQPAQQIVQHLGRMAPVGGVNETAVLELPEDEADAFFLVGPRKRDFPAHLLGKERGRLSFSFACFQAPPDFEKRDQDRSRQVIGRLA